MPVATWRPGVGPADDTTDAGSQARPHASAESYSHADGHTSTDAPAHRNYTAGRVNGIADPHAIEHCSTESYAHAGPDIDSDVNTHCDSDA